MPNWAEVEIELEIPTKNVEKFLECFMGWKDKSDNPEQFYIARTYLESCSYDDMDINNLGETIKVSIVASAAWSIYSCWISGFVDDRPYKTKTMESFCIDFDIIWLKAYAIEEGVGFTEDYEYKKDSSIIYDCNNIPKGFVRL